ncbi:MAG: tRNA pseudouridine(38-40) synthase TruA [Acidobacteria bacterium]|nr:tRNA pseudouridine(38-40) synthase TruA [Acidobacteriota bacterium]
MRLKLTIEYAGTRYSGWQIQKNARTVQGEIERALREGADVRRFELYGSGRTDAGVHALAQVAHLDLDTTLPTELLRQRINDSLPSDINLLRVEPVRHKFHARHDAVARSYVYQIARRRTAFGKALVWWVKDDLDVGAMRAAARHFVGMHDFRSFSDDDPDDKSTQVLLERFDVHERGDVVLVHIEGSHFLWKMVRRLVGVLVEVGRGGMTARDAGGMLVEPSTLPARLTAPASGLFLHRVYYPGDRRNDPLEPVIALPRC